MKKYRIKKTDALTLNGLRGLHIVPFCEHYKEVLVLDTNYLNNFSVCREMTTLPNNCDSQLVCAVLKEMQDGKTTSEVVTILKEYLHCAEKKDKNNEIKSDLKGAIKEIFFGLLLVGGSVAGFVLMLVLIGIVPIYASWISLLILPIVVVAAYGAINTLIGVAKFGFGIFSYCFNHKNISQLLLLENQLRKLCLQVTQPPTYDEVVKNNPISSAPVLQLEPPTYDEINERVVKDDARQALSANSVTTPAVPIPTHVTVYNTNFFPPPAYTATNNTMDNLDHRVLCNFMRT